MFEENNNNIVLDSIFWFKVNKEICQGKIINIPLIYNECDQKYLGMKWTNTKK